jgi:hypothetical protein
MPFQSAAQWCRGIRKTAAPCGACLDRRGRQRRGHRDGRRYAWSLPNLCDHLRKQQLRVVSGDAESASQTLELNWVRHDPTRFDLRNKALVEPSPARKRRLAQAARRPQLG